MREVFQEYLQREDYQKDEEEGKKNDKKIKTYIIESNGSKPQDGVSMPEGASLRTTDDENLFVVDYREGGHNPIYIDTSDSRFWSVHSYAGSEHVHDFLKYFITQNKSRLDFSWFPSNFLETKCDIGLKEGFNLKYENAFFKADAGKNLRKLSMVLWGGRPSEIFGGLKLNQDLAAALSLSMVRASFSTDLGYVKESIDWRGKFVLGKGDSFESHLLAVDKVKRSYSSIIKQLEEAYRITYHSSERGYGVKGTYSLLELSKEIEDLSGFVQQLLSCTHPFRIFGIPDFVEKDFVVIRAVDLHTYDKFNIEVMPNYIRVFLYQNGCANVITRLMTNLQHHYDSQIKLVGNENERII